MPFNGSGTFVSLPAPDFPALPGTTILASSFNANMNDLFTNGLTKCMTRDGQSPPTANLPMGGFKFTGMANGSADTDSATLGQVTALRGQVGAVDWDTRVTTGIFEATAASLTGPATNFPPTPDLGQLVVIAQGALVNQKYITQNNIYIRQKVGGTFSAWTFGIVNPNHIINGDYRLWQAGIASGVGTGKRYLSDCNYESSTGTTYNPSLQNWPVGQVDVDPAAKFFKRVIVASVAGASNFCITAFPIESVRTLAGRTVTVSFYAKANVSLPVAVELLQDFGTGGGASAQVFTSLGKKTLTTSWARYSFTGVLPNISGKTIGTDGKDNILMNIWLDAGSSFNSRSATLGQQSGTFDFWGVKVEEASAATPFQADLPSITVTKAFRFYKVLFNVGFNAWAGAAGQGLLSSVDIGTRMLYNPTATFVAGASGTANMGGFTAVAFSAGSVQFGGAAVAIGAAACYLDITLDARL